MNHLKLRHAFVIGTLASAMALVTTGCSDSDDRGSMLDSGSADRAGMDSSAWDARIVERVRTGLAAERSLSASASDIDVAVSNGVVTLSGEVADAAAKSAAERSARAVDGVQRVRNDLTLSRAVQASSGQRAGSQTGSDAGHYGEQAASGADSLGEAVSDSWITTKVKAELFSDDISSGFEVGVETNDGWVTLSGQLGNREAVDHIRNLVESIEGVRGVDISNLNVVARN